MCLQTKYMNEISCLRNFPLCRLENPPASFPFPGSCITHTRFCEMGNSRWRQNRNYNQEPRNAHPRWNNPPPPPHPSSRYWPNNSVPSWEMQFCAVVGLVPWWKVVDAKKYMSCYKNVFEWDDSAGEEAFHNAKQRFWAQMNGLPCEISPPDPDIYIDNINYDAYIDPELVLDLDREYVAHDEEVNGRTAKGRKRNYSNTVSEYVSGGHDKNQDNCENPWECNYTPCKNESRGDCLDQWDTFVNNTKKLANNDNPWERSCSQSNGDVKENTWGDSGGNSWSRKPGENHVNQLINMNNAENPWEQSCQGAGHAKGNGWEDIRDNSGGWSHWECNHNESRKLGIGDNPWDHSTSNKTLRHTSWKDWGDASRGWKTWDKCNNKPKDLESKRANGGWGSWDAGCRKREDSHQYVSKYKSFRFQGDDPQRGNDQSTGNYWRKGRANKRVSFAFE